MADRPAAELPPYARRAAVYFTPNGYWEAVCMCGWQSALWWTKPQADESAGRHVCAALRASQEGQT